MKNFIFTIVAKIEEKVKSTHYVVIIIIHNFVARINNNSCIHKSIQVDNNFN